MARRVPALQEALQRGDGGTPHPPLPRSLPGAATGAETAAAADAALPVGGIVGLAQPPAEAGECVLNSGRDRCVRDRVRVVKSDGEGRHEVSLIVIYKDNAIHITCL